MKTLVKKGKNNYKMMEFDENDLRPCYGSNSKYGEIGCGKLICKAREYIPEIKRWIQVPVIKVPKAVGLFDDENSSKTEWQNHFIDCKDRDKFRSK